MTARIANSITDDEGGIIHKMEDKLEKLKAYLNQFFDD